MILYKTISLPASSFHLPDLSSLQHTVFFDIETTGLSWRSSHLYLIGAACLKGEHFILHQWFLQKPSEEKELLLQFSSFLKPFKQLIHYNGQTFDLPYLLRKYMYYQLSEPLSSLESLDLYHLIRPFRHLFPLASLKQKDLEIMLGIDRKDPYTGGQLIDCYREYLQTGSEQLSERLLLHNFEDVCGLISLHSVTAYSSLAGGNLLPQTPALERDHLLLPFILSRPLPIPLSLSKNGCVLQIEGTKAFIRVRGEKTTLKHFYSNYKDYYYLPLEDAAIHKSVAIYVDTAHRQKAKPSNCYQKATGLFFPQPCQRFSPVFRRDGQKNPTYFLMDEKWPDNPQLLKTYISDLLTDLLFS